MNQVRFLSNIVSLLSQTQKMKIISLRRFSWKSCLATRRGSYCWAQKTRGGANIFPNAQAHWQGGWTKVLSKTIGQKEPCPIKRNKSRSHFPNIRRAMCLINLLETTLFISQLCSSNPWLPSCLFKHFAISVQFENLLNKDKIFTYVSVISMDQDRTCWNQIVLSYNCWSTVYWIHRNSKISFQLQNTTILNSGCFWND